MSKLISLRIQSSFGMFNQSFSNTGGYKTYPFPTKTAIIGLLGSILGCNFNETIDLFSNIKVGIIISSPIKYGNLTYNTHYGQRPDRERVGSRVNVRQEYLYQPEFQIIIRFPSNIDSNLLVELKERFPGLKSSNLLSAIEEILKNEMTYYPLYMGKNAHFIEYELIDEEFGSLGKTDDFVIASSIIPMNVISDFKIEGEDDDIYTNNSYQLTYLHNFPLIETKSRHFPTKISIAYVSSELKLHVKLNQDKLNDYELLTDKNGNLVVLI